MLVRRTYLNHRHVAAESSATVKFLCLAQKYRDVVRISCLHAFADIAAYEECLMEEDAAEFRIGIWSRAFRVEMVYPYVLEFSCFSSSAQSLDEYTWRACNAAKMYVVARLDDLYGFVSRYEVNLFTHNYVIEPQR